MPDIPTIHSFETIDGEQFTIDDDFYVIFHQENYPITEITSDGLVFEVHTSIGLVALYHSDHIKAVHIEPQLKHKEEDDHNAAVEEELANYPDDGDTLQ